MKKVLIADDDERVLLLCTVLLHAVGIDPVTAKDGKEAWEKALEYKPDLILLDIMMPEDNGFSVCQKIRAHPDLKNTKVIIVSAKLYPQDHVLAREAGADGFIPKPFDVDRLVKEVQSALS